MLKVFSVRSGEQIAGKQWWVKKLHASSQLQFDHFFPWWRTVLLSWMWWSMTFCWSCTSYWNFIPLFTSLTEWFHFKEGHFVLLCWRHQAAQGTTAAAWFFKARQGVQVPRQGWAFHMAHFGFDLTVCIPVTYHFPKSASSGSIRSSHLLTPPCNTMIDP